MTRRLDRFARAAGKVALVALLSLAVVELELRITGVGGGAQQAAAAARIHDFMFFDEKGCFRIAPGARGLHAGCGGPEVAIEVNSLGLRGPEPLLHPVRRVALLGDSIVFSGGVPWEQSLVGRVQRRWQADPQRAGWEVLNFGMSDSGLAEYEVKLREQVLALGPQVVVVGLYLNDTVPPQGFAAGRRGPAAPPAPGPLDRLRAVQLVRRLRRAAAAERDVDLNARFGWAKRYGSGRYLTDAAEWRALVGEARLDWGAAFAPGAGPAIRASLGRMRDLCRASGAELRVAMFPVGPQVLMPDPPAGYDQPQQDVRALAAELGIPFLDLLPALRERRSPALFCDHCHLTAEGSAAVADALIGFLAR